MIIQLKPPTPSTPVVLFSFTFNSAPPSSLPLPTAYNNQLQLLAQHDIQIPKSLHMLDKSIWLVACLHEVIFDLSPHDGTDFVTIRCTFIDGDVREWTFRNEECVKDLEDVLRDVEWSHIQSQREKYERYGIDHSHTDSPPSPQPQKKHKKQRSLLMTLVSLVSPNSSHSSRMPPRGHSPPSSPPPPPPAPPSTLSAHRLRRRARAALIDAFRRFVYSEFSSYTPISGSGFGFLTWVVRSNLRQTDDKLESLLRQAGLAGETRFRGRRNYIPDSPFFDDEEVEQTSLESRSTDTDGSSVHTPTEHSSFPLPYFQQKSRPIPNCPRTPTPPSPSPNTETLNALHALSNQSDRLQQLLSQLHHARLATENDEKQVLAILEIKARRRAWSNRSLLGGARMSDIGFSTPERSSPLSRGSISAEGLGWDAEREAFPIAVDEVGRRIRGLDIRTAPFPSPKREKNTPMLFPVVEEEELEDDISLLMPGGESLIEIPLSPNTSGSWSEGDSDDGEKSSVRLVEDAENGFLQPLQLPFSDQQPQYAYRQQSPPLPSPVPPTPVRARTRSMLGRAPRPLAPTFELDSNLPSEAEVSSSQLHVSGSSLASHPHAMPHANHPTFLHVFNPQTKIEIFDDECSSSPSSSCPSPHLPYSNLSASISVHDGGGIEGGQEEFTLAMDLSPPRSSHLPLHPTSPSSYHSQSLPPPFQSLQRGLGGKKRGLLHDDWIIGTDSSMKVEMDVHSQ
ncbi:unnamed protein product [Somion occarium]|uniref:Uncharacterized protein n=1 Tax=Somion occarium TaxID=3059160 RepID=A0ABP1DR38_9APHY